MSHLTLSYSIADQDFVRTDSLGILNLSVQMLHFLARRPEIQRLNVLSNSSLSDRLQLPPEVPVTLHDSAFRHMSGRVIWDQWRAYAEGARLGNKWFFLPKGYASFIRPCPVKLATCVADASYEYYKRIYPKEVPWLKKWYYDFCVRGTIKHSTIIFTISDFTKSEVLRIAKDYRITPPPVQTIGIGFTRPEISPEKKARVLVLAGRWPHKRTDLAIEYLSRWYLESRFNGTIEWIGRFPAGLKPPELPRWLVHSRLPDPDFKRLKAESRVLVYFSDYEGFGMPPVEAALVGTAPVYSDLPATREIMGGAGFSFQNQSYESFARAMAAALAAPREQIESWGESLLQRHNWPAVVDRVIRGLTECDKLESERAGNR